MPEPIIINNWINNKEVTAEKYNDCYDPGKFDEIVSKVAQGTEADIEAACEAAHAAQPAWEALPLSERKAYAEKLLQITQESMADLVDLEVRDCGHERRTAEVDFGIAMGSWQYYLSVIDKFMESEVIEDETSWTRIDKVAKGVCAGIVPWNMPICLTMSKLPLALLTGNTFILKPPSTGPAALTELMKRYAQALPDGVLNVVNGSGSRLGKALAANPYVRKIGFTGGTAGDVECAQELKATTMELGGNDAAIVLADADPAKVVPEMLHGCLDRSGQICFAIKRIYVPKDRIDEYFEIFKEVVGQLKTGYGMNPDAYYGPLNNKNQYDFVNGLIEESKNDPNVDIVEVGGKSDPELWDKGYYIMPHIAKAHHCANDVSVVTQEQFGPIIPLIPYETEEQAIELANDSEFGLCSSVWGADTDHAAEVATQIRAGQTFVNGHSLFALDFGVPFGGFKQSGLGREFTGDLSLSAYIDWHAVRILKTSEVDK